MTEHVTQNDLIMLKNGKLGRDELLRFDDHLDTCSLCQEFVATRISHFGDAAQFTRALLGSHHLTYQQLEAYADGKLNFEDKPALDHHLKLCEECSEDLGELQGTRFESDVSEAASATPRGWFTFLFARPIPVLASIVVIVAMIGVAWILFQKESAPAITEVQDATAPAIAPVIPPPAPSESPSNEATTPVLLAVSILDAGRPVGLTRDGVLSGYESVPEQYRNLVKTTLSSGRAPLPNLDDLRGATGTLMGDNDSATFRVHSPVGKVIRDASPAFTWEAVPGADKYVVDVFDENFRSVASSGEIKSTVWKTTLPRGRTYIWQVKAVRKDETLTAPQRPAPDARFRIIDSRTANDLAALRRSNTRSHLLLGTAYANAGLIDEAIREFEMLARQNPGSDVPKKLLRQLRTAK